MKIPATSAAAVVAATAALLTLVAACGSQQAAMGGATSPTSAPVSLTIQVRPGAHAAAQSWSLTCDPAGGTLPHPAAGCAALARVANPFAPVGRGIMCPMIYGGPQTATIEGRWHGKSVHATFSRADGCQTARWSRIAAVFGPYASPAATP
jgi:Subtilisin inhibitor-like